MLPKSIPLRRCIYYAVAAVVLPSVIVGILLAIYLPRAPDASPAYITINSITPSMDALAMDVDIGVKIRNKNSRVPIAFDPVPVSFAFPASPQEEVGTGILEAGEVPPSGEITRPMHSAFKAPWSAVGSNFMRDMNRGASQIIVRGKVKGFSTVLSTGFRLTSDLECLITYYWEDGRTTHSCEQSKRIRLGYTSS